MAESVSSPNSPGASHTSQLAKRRASDYSRQMPNLNLITDPFIYDLVPAVSSQGARDADVWKCMHQPPSITPLTITKPQPPLRESLAAASLIFPRLHADMLAMGQQTNVQSLKIGLLRVESIL